MLTISPPKNRTPKKVQFARTKTAICRTAFDRVTHKQGK